MRPDTVRQVVSSLIDPQSSDLLDPSDSSDPSGIDIVQVACTRNPMKRRLCLDHYTIATALPDGLHVLPDRLWSKQRLFVVCHL